MKSEISATEAARRFSEVLNRVRYRNETFVVKRGGEPVCEIIPVRSKTFTGREFVELLRSLPHPDQEYLDAVERHVRKQPKAEKSKWPR
ncbi:MAG TPA: type II toxin-antitoxin system prevent-host-death family antitoxin [Candidatus Acidoferrales bacterium]|jgi:prevent-host-death family protein|nr:type II toxin-antitoxin system prevent-host-death family antitoxin [Candidatus Acidoferrales bacterium]